MSRNNVIAKITVEFEDSRVINIDPKTGHSLIFLLDCGDQIAHIVAGRVSELVKLYWAIGQEYPELPKYLASIRKKTEAFRDAPVGGTA
jgi:hypothetical protein